MDRRRRYYSLQVIPEAPGGIHARDCPCCRVRQQVEEGCRQAVGMHGAGLGNGTIARELGRWLDRHSVAAVMQFVDGALEPAANTHHWNGAHK